MKSVIVVPARLNSSRFPEKLIQKLGGITIIEQVLIQCLKSKEAEQVYLATNSEKIVEHTKHLPICTLYKNREYSNGTERIADAIASFSDIEFVLNVQADEPFIDPDLLDLMIRTMRSDPSVSICSARSLKVFNSDLIQEVKVTEDKDSFALNFYRESVDAKLKSYKHIGIYGFKFDILQRIINLPQTANESAKNLEQLRWLDNGYRIKMIPSDYKSISIDTPEDFNKARKYIHKMTKE